MENMQNCEDDYMMEEQVVMQVQSNISQNRAPRMRNQGSSFQRGGTRVFEKNQKSLFKEIETCKQYCETHYYNEISSSSFK